MASPGKSLDINQPVENPALVAAIEQLIASETPETEAAMVAELKTAYFLSPVAIDPPPAASGGMAHFPQGTSIQFALLPGVNEQGVLFPAFTDWGELRKWRASPAFSEIRGGGGRPPRRRGSPPPSSTPRDISFKVERFPFQTADK